MKCLVLAILSCTLAIQAKPQYGGMGQFGGGQFGSNYGMGGEGGYQGGGYGAQGMQGGHDSAHHSSSITSYVNAQESGGHDIGGGSSFGMGGGQQGGYNQYGGGGSSFGGQQYGAGMGGMGMIPGMGIGK